MAKKIRGKTYLSPDDVATRASVKIRTARRWIADRGVPGCKTRLLRVRMRDGVPHVEEDNLDRFLEDKTAKRERRKPSAPSVGTPKIKPIIEWNREPYISAGEAARRAGVVKSAIYHWIHGIVPHSPLTVIRLGGKGGPYYINEESFTQALRERFREAVVPKQKGLAKLEAHLILYTPKDPARILLFQSRAARSYDIISGDVEPRETLCEAVVRLAREKAHIVIDLGWPRLVHVMHRHGDPMRMSFFFTLGEYAWRGEVKNICTDEYGGMEWHRAETLPENMVEYIRAGLSCWRAGVLNSAYGWPDAIFEEL